MNLGIFIIGAITFFIAFSFFKVSAFKKTKNADFIYWTRNIYKPQELEASFSENKFFEKIITKILKRE